MLEIRTRTDDETHDASASLILPFELRSRSRLRATLDDGREVALFLPRGTVLRGGDRLLASDGRVVIVRAAEERVSTARSEDPDALLRAAFHLGNRHVPVEIGRAMLRYEHDHVLDEMVRGLGLEIVVEHAPFEPEGGAYGGHGPLQSSHHHGHGHAHGHTVLNLLQDFGLH